MTNKPNAWVKRRRKVLVKQFGGKCQHRGCNVRGSAHLQFAHVRRTKLSGTGPRGRKEKAADIAAHPRSYTLRCPKHHASDFRSQHARFRRL